MGPMSNEVSYLHSQSGPLRAVRRIGVLELFCAIMVITV